MGIDLLVNFIQEVKDAKSEDVFDKRNGVLSVFCLVLICFCLAAGSVQAADLFLAAKNYDAGMPTSVATADFNGDGKPDIVASNGGLSSVNVLMNNGDGTFAPAVPYGVGYHPQAIAVADFNGDGKPDIVAGNTDNTISVLINQGDGTFAAAVTYAGSGPTTGGGGILSIAVGDLTGDGKPEIVTTASDVYDGTINVLKNKGTRHIRRRCIVQRRRSPGKFRSLGRL